MARFRPRPGTSRYHARESEARWRGRDDEPYRYPLCRRPEISGYLASLCSRWESEVLEPAGFLAGRRHKTLARDRRLRHAYLHSLAFGTTRVLWQVTAYREYLRIGATDDLEYRVNMLFCAYQDFFNMYNSALDTLGILGDEYYSPEHSFFELRRRFISSIMFWGVSENHRTDKSDSHRL